MYRARIIARSLMIQLCLLIPTLLLGTGPASASMGSDMVGKILSNLIASGEYIIGSSYIEDEKEGKVKVVVETTDGKKVYDESGQMLEQTDHQGNKTFFKNGIPVKTVSPSGAIISTTQVQKASRGEKWIESRDYMGNLEKRRINANGEMIERVDQAGKRFHCKVDKDSQGQTTAITEINQLDGMRTTRFVNPKNGEVEAILDEKGNLTMVQYQKDEKGRKLASLEMNTQTGLVTEKRYDAMGRETLITDSSGMTKEIAYETNQTNQVVYSSESITDPSGDKYKLEKTFDSASRVTSEHDSRGKTVKYDYTVEENGHVSKIVENESIVNDKGEKIENERVKVMDEKDRIKTVYENGFVTEYDYESDENGRIEKTWETKYIADGMQKLYSQVTELDTNGMPSRSEKWDEQGPIGKRHSVTMFKSDPLTGKTQKTYTMDDLGDLTVTEMDERGYPETTESWQQYGAKLKRHSVTTVKSDSLTGLATETESVDDMGDRTRTVMDKRGLAENSETWNTHGALLKRHSMTQITTNPYTGKPEKTVTVNDRGDVTITYMDAQGMAVMSEMHETHGAVLGRDKVSTIQNDPYTGMASSVTTQSALGTSLTMMDKNGLPIQSESNDVYGAGMKKHKVTDLEVDDNTGLTVKTTTLNDRDDKVETTMDEQGMPVLSESWNSLGAELKKHSITQIETNAATEMTQQTLTINDLGDITQTVMDENGLATDSLSIKALGAVLKRTSQTTIQTDSETGQTVQTMSVNLRQDRTLTVMDENGLAVKSESWLALGANQKKHSVTEIDTNQETGETTMTVGRNDRGDVNQTWMDEDGLAVKSENQSALGAELKRHSFTGIATDPRTGETSATVSRNDRADETVTMMDENGLAVKSESSLALGAILKRTSETAIQTDMNTGETTGTFSLNNRDDRTWTKMNADGLAEKSRSVNSLGATLKRTNMTAIETDTDTGETAATYSVNDRNDFTATKMDSDGLATQSQGRMAMGATLKRTSTTLITPNRKTGETAESLSVNERGDQTWTGMNMDGLAMVSESWSAYGANLKKHNLTAIQTDTMTGETAQTMTVNDRGDQTWTGMNKHGLAVKSESWQALGAEGKAHSVSAIETNPDTGETVASTSFNDRGDKTWTEMNGDGLAVTSESWLAYGALLKRHSVSEIDTDSATGEMRSTKNLNDRGDRTMTRMDQNGLAVGSESTLALGANLKRNSTTEIVTDQDTGETAETISLNDRGDKTHTWMDENGLAIMSDSALALGATLKRHSVTNISTDGYTGETTQTLSVNDRGDVTQSWMDADGLAVKSEATAALGANLKKHNVTDIKTNINTGETDETLSRNDRGDSTHTFMDENGLAVKSESEMALGAILKRTSDTLILTDADTGETSKTYSLNGRDDRSWTQMDGNGLAERSYSIASLGATLKRTSNTAIDTNDATGETQMSYSINNRNDRTLTKMNENGLAVQSQSEMALGAGLKRNSVTQISPNVDTGETAETLSVNDRGDRTWTGMNMHGLAMVSEAWTALGATLKRHSVTSIATDEYTGETSQTMNTNDRGDQTWTSMDVHGLAQRSESWQALGATDKTHSVTDITTNADTGETLETKNLNDRGDVSQTWMDENGLAEKSEGWLALGAIQKRHSLTMIDCNFSTGETRSTKNTNDRGDVTLTQMDGNGLAKSSVAHLALGAILKRDSTTEITVDEETGETLETHNINNRGDQTHTWMNEHGLAERSETWLAFGADLKTHSTTTIHTDAKSGETVATENVNDRGDFAATLMDANGLAYFSESQLALGAELKKSSTTDIMTNLYTGETDSTFNQNKRGDATMTYMDENGLATGSKGLLALGAIKKRSNSTRIVTDANTGEIDETLSINGRRDITYTKMDGEGLPETSYSYLSLGANLKKKSVTNLMVDSQTGETAASYTVNELGDTVLTLMDYDGLPAASESNQVLGPLQKRHGMNVITVDRQTGETRMNESVNDLGERTITHMNEHGLAYANESWQVLGAKLKRHSVGEMGFDWQTGEINYSKSVNDMGDLSETFMDANGLAYRSHSVDTTGILDGREKETDIDANQDTGVTMRTRTEDDLHAGPVVTTMNMHGLAVSSVGVDANGPIAGRLKNTVMVPNMENGLTIETFTTDALHTGPVHTIMDDNGFAVESSTVNKYGPELGRHQVTIMTPDEDTGMTLMSDSKTVDEESGIVINRTTTYNHPELGIPRYAETVASFGAYQHKTTEFTDVNENNGMVRYSEVCDDGGITENEHNEFGIARSKRTNVLGAIKEVETENNLDTQTGLVISAASTDRKGKTLIEFDENGLTKKSIRTNNGAHYVVTETTTTETLNPYTGSPLLSVSNNGHSVTTKEFDMDGFMTRSDSKQWGETTTTTYVNNPLTGMPVYSESEAPTGLTKTHYEDNGLALDSEFTAIIGMNSISTNYYDENLDSTSTKSVDERGNISVSVVNLAGEVTHTYSKSGTTTMDLKNNRAASSSGPSGSTTYSYDGRWMDKTVSTNDEGTSTTWYEHRPNGASCKVKSKDGTTTYKNTYNSRGFVTYRTEKNDKGDTGFSNFNDYGDQLYSEWKGTMKAEPADKYGNKFLGGTWKSETTYEVSSKGDTKSWTTKSSWKGKQYYAEVGHYEPTCLEWDEDGTACVTLGEETYVVDQAAYTKSVGKSETKTDKPDFSPKSESWILAHISGQPLEGGVLLSGRITKPAGTKVGAAAVSGPRDATKAGYHDVYQKQLIASMATKEVEDSLKESFAPTVKSIQDKLAKFRSNQSLLSLRQIASHVYSGKGEFDKAFAAAENKATFLMEAVREAYYYFSGEQLAPSELSLESVTQALSLTERRPGTGTLQDWLEFSATEAQRKQIGDQLVEVSKKLSTTTDAAEQAYMLEALWDKLAGTLGKIAALKYGDGISKDALVQWLGQSLQTKDDVQLVASRLLQDKKLAPKSVKTATGVALGGSTVQSAAVKDDYSDLDDSTRIGIMDEVKAATVAKDVADEMPVNVDLKLEAGDDLVEMQDVDDLLKKSSLKVEQKEKVAGLHHMQLAEELALEGTRKKDQKGRVIEIKAKNGDKTKIDYQKDGKVKIEVVSPKNKILSLAEYRKGLLKKIVMKDGTQLTLTTGKDKDGKSKGITALLQKGMFKNTYKYGKNGTLKNVVKQEGDRSRLEKVADEEEKEKLLINEEKEKDKRTREEKLGGKKRRAQ